MRPARLAALALALVAILCAGLWLGGHPAKLPQPLRDVFVGGNGGLNVNVQALNGVSVGGDGGDTSSSQDASGGDGGDG